ncbi:hypothetical protein LTR95_008541 [Oleoguttula sp. CCFEE 5521]
MTNPTSARPRTGRRESVSNAPVSGNRVRKSSVANIAGAATNGLSTNPVRPRANTIDLSSLGLVDMSHPSFSRLQARGLGITHGHAQSMGNNAFNNGMATDYRGMSTAMGNHGNLAGLSKINTHTMGMNPIDAMKSAPAVPGFGGFDLDQLFSPDTTVNPAQLHSNYAMSQNNANTMMPQMSHYMNMQPTMDEPEDFSWMRNWTMQNMNGMDNENAMDDSSPSRISSGDSPGDYNEMMSNSNAGLQTQQSAWTTQGLRRSQSLAGGQFHMDAMVHGLPHVDSSISELSPHGTLNGNTANDQYFQQAMLLQNLHQQAALEKSHSLQQNDAQNMILHGVPAPLSNISSESPDMSSSSMTGSARQSSVTSVSTDSITEATRQALLNSLAQPSVFGMGHRKFSQPAISSPLSQSTTRGSAASPTLPSTASIRKYVDAFLQFAMPHVPVLHVPTLSFDSVDYSNSIRGGSAAAKLAQNPIMGGGGCLILAMAAMGALYEYEHVASKELFEAGKKMIGLYLEERRKADMCAAVSGSPPSDGMPGHTPLWLVQAMLLNVIYGHQCGDKISADIASNHCAALVSLARAAELGEPANGSPSSSLGAGENQSPDVQMRDASTGEARNTSTRPASDMDIQSQWIEWKTAEERKRTMFAIFIISSLLTTAYNQTPTIMNSEVTLDLPCDEQLWAAETAQAWHSLGGAAAAEHGAVSFNEALSILLTSHERKSAPYSSGTYASHHSQVVAQQHGEDPYADAELAPSTFGCLVLINALHNYIWETRSRHPGDHWTAQESESMFAHIEPALNAWQVAWKANPRHKLERPNPFGLGPLSADCIPLLDLAFVRLFVNLGRAKEAFWQRKFDEMADELARGSEIVQHAEAITQDELVSPKTTPDSQRRASQYSAPLQAPTRREKHLRKAAFYAADSLHIACEFHLTYADVTAHELPIQSAMCFFDCCQVLAEWACTVQERVGWHIGVLGRDRIDMSTVPAIMVLEREDMDLFRKIEHVCESMENKRVQQETLLAMDMPSLNVAPAMHAMHNNVHLSSCGYGSKILRITAMMLEKAVVWPVTHVMAKALEVQASHMDQRAAASIAK